MDKKKVAPMFSELRLLIITKGYTMGDVAKAIGRTPQSLSLKFNGKSEFTLPDIVMIYDFLGLQSSEKYFIEPKLLERKQYSKKRKAK